MNGYVATIGMFDGVHQGHQFVLRHVVETARKRGLQSMAITFDHPVNKGAVVLTPTDDKRLLLSKTGVDWVEVLSFTDELRQMTARQFMQQVLHEQLGVSVLLTGYDNRFGHHRTEGFDDYVRYGRELGIEVVGLPPAPSELAGLSGVVSSSLIRRLLTEGRVREASQALGYPYTITGRVVHGQHIGTQLGFPTANVHPLCDRQLIPAAGVYAVKVRLQHSMTFMHAMMNIGHRPTFDGQQQTLEVHIFQLHEDLYDQHLAVSLVERIRDERRFDTIEALQVQLTNDAQRAQELL